MNTAVKVVLALEAVVFVLFVWGMWRTTRQLEACPWCYEKSCIDSALCTCKKPCGKSYCKRALDAEVTAALNGGGGGQ